MFFAENTGGVCSNVPRNFPIAWASSSRVGRRSQVVTIVPDASSVSVVRPNATVAS
jgi:hypothetical protein